MSIFAPQCSMDDTVFCKLMNILVSVVVEMLSNICLFISIKTNYDKFYK